MTLRRAVHRLLFDEAGAGRLVAASIAVLIVANAVALTLETVPELEASWTPFLTWFERGSISIFVVEYLARVWCCIEESRYQRPFWGRLAYMATPLALIDLVVLLPVLLPLNIDLRTLRICRLLRLVRLFRYQPYATSVRTFAIVVKERRGDLMLCGMLAVVAIGLAATGMYLAERDAQPEKMGSIPACIWWSVIHLTTIGYGDVYPITVLGKMLAGVTALIGIGVVTLPGSIVAMSYVDLLRERKSMGIQEDLSQ